MGEIADWMVEQEIDKAIRLGSSSIRFNDNNYNPSLPVNEYRKLINFLTTNLKMPNYLAKKLIVENLIKRGEFPVPNFTRLNPDEKLQLFNIISKAGLKLEGYNHSTMQKHYEMAKEKGIAKEMKVPNAEVENLFKSELAMTEEGEFLLVIERGMYREVVAVSFAYPHYRSKGFYAERKSSIFAKEADTDKMVINMREIFNSLTTLLNNLASADLLNEEAYNNVMDGFEPFIYEALDFSEIEGMLGKTSGLKDGKKKRIKARGTKGSTILKKD